MGLRERLEARREELEAAYERRRQGEIAANLEQMRSQRSRELTEAGIRRAELFVRLEELWILDLLTDMTGVIDPIQSWEEEENDKWGWQLVDPAVLDTNEPIDPSVKLIITHNDPLPYGGYSFDVVQLQFEEGDVLKIAGEYPELDTVIDHNLGTDEALRETVEAAFVEAFLNPRSPEPASPIQIFPGAEHWRHFNELQPKPTD